MGGPGEPGLGGVPEGGGQRLGGRGRAAWCGGLWTAAWSEERRGKPEAAAPRAGEGQGEEGRGRNQVEERPAGSGGTRHL